MEMLAHISGQIHGHPGDLTIIIIASIIIAAIAANLYLLRKY